MYSAMEAWTQKTAIYGTFISFAWKQLLLQKKMYISQTHFGFTNVGSKMLRLLDIALSFWHFWSWTPCKGKGYPWNETVSTAAVACVNCVTVKELDSKNALRLIWHFFSYCSSLYFSGWSIKTTDIYFSNQSIINTSADS